MADLSRRDRGQILLVAALALAVTFVALALILNSAIFTENLASRGDTTGGQDVIEYRSDLQNGVGEILEFENRNVSGSDSRDDVEERVNTSIGDLNPMLTRQWARSGATANVTLSSRTDGSRIYQTDHTRDFTAGDSTTANWQVAGNVDNTRAFGINVSQSGLLSCTLFDDCYNVSVMDGSGNVWNMTVQDTANGVEVHVDNGSSVTACQPVDEPFVEVDITAGTVAGERCPALSFADAPPNTYDIWFENGDQIEGTYSMVVDNRNIADSPPGEFSSSSDDPFVDPALYNVTLDYDFTTSLVSMDSTVDVAPGESDE